MMRPILILTLLLTLAFSLGTGVQPLLVRADDAGDSDNLFKVVLGEGRRMFANHFAIKADVYLHSGFYPSIFDQAAKVEDAESGHADPHQHGPCCDHDHDHAHHDHDHAHHDHDHAHHDHDHAHHDHDHDHATTPADGHNCCADGVKRSKDWIERLGRHFYVSEHAHLEGGAEREILPWIKLSSQLDPQRIESYTVGGYWLAERLDKPEEAEAFLREGLRANPNSYEILFSLGKIYRQLEQPERARNVWRLALRRWNEVELAKEEPDTDGRGRILVYLAQLESDTGNLQAAIQYFQEAKAYNPSPEALDVRIADLQEKLAQPAPKAGKAAH